MKYFRKLSFASKLLSLFLITILVPMVLVMILIYHISKNTLEDKTNDYLKNIGNVTISKLEDSIKYVEDTGFFVAGNTTIQEMLIAELSGELSNAESYLSYNQVRDALEMHSVVKQEIQSIYLEAQSGRRYNFSKNANYFDFYTIGNDVEENSWILKDKALYYYRNISTYLGKEQLGRMAIQVDPEVFYHIIKDIDYSSSGEVYLLNQQREIVAGGTTYEMGQRLGQDFDALSIDKNIIYQGVLVNGESNTVYISQEISNGWRLLLSIPTQYYVNDIMELQSQIFFVIVSSAILIVLVIIYISKQVTRPILTLSKAMEEVGKGNLDVNCVIESGDEIGVLSQSFNQMVKDMKLLINSEYEQKVMKQGAEMKSLQMQINPHFLYNTLDTINWMARIHSLDDIGDITSSLGELMRYSLSKDEFVTIYEEVENLKNYVAIQDVRYGDKMTVEFQIANDVLECMIPKLLVQPILENAIIHGVEDKIEESIIIVSIFRQNQDLYVIVEDDGVGMNQEAIERILDENSKIQGEHTSIGVKNVNQRIKMVFGNECGMQIQSVLGDGTKITLRMKVHDGTEGEHHIEAPQFY